MESRPIGPEAAFLGPRTGRARHWTDRARRVVLGPYSRRFARPCRPPTPAPWQGLLGSASLSAGSPRAKWAGWVTPVLPTRYTHPAIPPRYHTPPPTPLCPHTTAVHHTPTACTYDRFWTSVGEPRGVNTGLVSGSQAGLYR